MAKGIRRKDLKGPDEFISVTHRVLEYARSNERQVGAVVVAVVVLVGVTLGVRAYRNWQLGQAEGALAAAYAEFSAGRRDGAAAGFLAVHTGWAGTPQASMALAYAGNTLAELGRDAEARKAFEALLESARDARLQQLAHYNLGMLGRRAGDDAEAAERFRQAARTAGPLRAVAWLAGRRISTEGFSPDETILRGLPAGMREYAEGRLRDAGAAGASSDVR